MSGSEVGASVLNKAPHHNMKTNEVGDWVDSVV